MEMIKKKEKKDDGRYIIFYEFEDENDSVREKKSPEDKYSDTEA
ncbi:MAG: hypothetical protein ACLFPF_11375 [Halanaerobiales bacterium]